MPPMYHIEVRGLPGMLAPLIQLSVTWNSVPASPTWQIFTNPRDERTELYVTGKFG